jgi:hypothetical protein
MTLSELIRESASNDNKTISEASINRLIEIAEVVSKEELGSDLYTFTGVAFLDDLIDGVLRIKETIEQREI